MWRTLLASEGVEHVSLSYIGLRRRIKDPSGWRIHDHFPDWQKVYVDSGCYTLNREDSPVGRDEALELAAAYHEFVSANLDAIEFASEFDASILGRDTIEENRASFWRTLPGLKWMPVWHSEYGITELRLMAGAYDRVGVLQADTSGQDVSAVLRQVSGHTRLHGVSMTRMDDMTAIPWSSAGSTSWLSTTMYGDTFVWTGRELKRYPRRYKEQARKRHRTWLADQGFDMDLIEADDNAELLRLSIWSWRHFAASISTRGVTMSPDEPPAPGQETPPAVAGRQEVPERNAELAPRRPKKLLPVLGIGWQKGSDREGNETDVPHLETPAGTLLRCDSCFMREKCPEASPGSECAFEIPVRVRTGSQMAALQDWLLETQAQRVAYMRLVEQAEGGYADVNLSTEMDRLQRMIAAKTAAAKEGFSLKIEATSSPGGPGILSNIFGKDVAGKMGALPAPVESRDVIEAEIISSD